MIGVTEIRGKNFLFGELLKVKSLVSCLRKSIECLCKHCFNLWICLFLVLLIQIICGLFCRACMATMGILYYRLVQRGLGEEELADDLQQ